MAESKEWINEHVCQKTGRRKLSFDSMKAAKDYLKRRPDGNEYNPYYCEICGKFHVGHKSQRTKITELNQKLERTEKKLEKEKERRLNSIPLQEKDKEILDLQEKLLAIQEEKTELEKKLAETIRRLDEATIVKDRQKHEIKKLKEDLDLSKYIEDFRQDAKNAREEVKKQKMFRDNLILKVGALRNIIIENGLELPEGI